MRLRLAPDGTMSVAPDPTIMVERCQFVQDGQQCLARATHEPDAHLFGPEPTLAPAFDATVALEDIARQAREVGAARRQWEAAKADAATAKKTWEREAGTLEAMILDVDRRSREAVEPSLPFVDPTTGEEVAR